MRIDKANTTLTRSYLIDATTALRENDLGKAEALVRECLTKEPDNIEALRLLAQIAAASSFEEDAEQLLRRAIFLAPGYAEAYADLTSLLCRSARAEEALALLDLAIARHPRAIWPLSLKAAILDAERRADESLTLHKELVTRGEKVAILWANYGHALGTMGRVDEAVTAYRTALGIEPENGSAWLGIANLRTVSLEAKDIDLLQQAITRSSELPRRAQLHFALGKALSDHGEFGPSFHQYKKGNELRQTIIPYRPTATRELVNKVKKLFDTRFVAERAGFGCEAPGPVFIVGMPRSGSTLVEQILACHPMAEGGGELFELQNLVAEVVGRGGAPEAWPEKLVTLGADTQHELGQRYLRSVLRHRRTSRLLLTDKMPSNWRFVPLIHLMLPGAKIIDVQRHPMACCFSAFTTYFNQETSFPTNLEDLGHYYADYADMMNLIDEVLPGKLYRIQYESLVSDLEEEVRRLLHFLQLPFDPACLRFHENARALYTPSAQQVRRPLDASANERWRDFEPWLAPLQTILRARRPSSVEC